jgi:hypothetical protein
MKTDFKALLTVLVLFAVVSCKPCKEIVTTVHDTVSHEVFITRHDTMLTTLPDSAGWTAYFECKKNNLGLFVPVIANQYTNSGNYIHVNTSQSGTATGLNVNVDCKTDSLKTRITLLEKTVKDYRDKETVKSVPINFLTGWQWVQVYFGRVLMGIVLIVILYFGIKFALKYFKIAI